MNKKTIMRCSICNNIDEGLTAYCITHGRSPHYIEEPKRKVEK